MITVFGKDRIGIIYAISQILYHEGVNIEDISQTILQGFFSMVMLVYIPEEIGIAALREKFAILTDEGLTVQVQKTEIFDIMHNL